MYFSCTLAENTADGVQITMLIHTASLHGYPVQSPFE